MFVQRLGFALHKPGDMIAKKGDKIKGMTMFIDGQVDATSTEPGDQTKLTVLEKLEIESSTYVKPGFVRSFYAGDSVGEDIFSEERAEMPFYLQCVKRCLFLKPVNALKHCC